MGSNNIMPLQGIRVIELGTHIAVPHSARLLAEWGADVVKIEGLTGEEWRQMGIMFKTPFSDEENPVFTADNACKKFISIDLKQPEGIEIIYKLLETADVFMTNVRPNALEKIGLGYEAVRNINDKIIYYSFNGYGLNGPDSKRPGFDGAAFWARTGPLVDWVRPDEMPIRVASGIGDVVSATMAAAGILAAIIGRNNSEKGTYISSSLFGCGIWHSNSEIVSTQKISDNQVMYPQADKNLKTPFVNCYKCKDSEWVFVSATDYRSAYPKFCHVLDLEEILHETRFSDQSKVVHNMEEFIEVISSKFALKPAFEWMVLFNDEGIACEVIKHFEDVHKDFQAWENGYLEEMIFPSGTKAAMVKAPMTFSAYSTRKLENSKPIGEDTVNVLKELGYEDDQIIEMISSNTIIGK